MKNGTLIINNSKNFANDIWQNESEFTEEEWKVAINSFADNLQDLYNYFCEKEDFEMADKLYILGDVINMFNNIDVKIKI